MSLSAIVPALALLGAVGRNDAAPQATIDAPVAAPTPKTTVHHAPGDPFERFNRKNYARQQAFDRHVFRPAAFGYKHIVPHPLRVALRHFFSNLGEPIVFLNYMLQLKPGKAIETVARFAINSTIGLAGTLDLAKAPTIRLPHRPNGFANTMGFYGVKPGPYLFLPFVGPTTLRDLFGNGVDGAVEAPTIAVRRSTSSIINCPTRSSRGWTCAPNRTATCRRCWRARSIPMRRCDRSICRTGRPRSGISTAASAPPRRPS